MYICGKLVNERGKEGQKSLKPCQRSFWIPAFVFKGAWVKGHKNLWYEISFRIHGHGSLRNSNVFLIVNFWKSMWANKGEGLKNYQKICPHGIFTSKKWHNMKTTCIKHRLNNRFKFKQVASVRIHRSCPPQILQ